MPVITLKYKDKKIREYPMAMGQSCTIGRKASNDIVIDNLAVSGSHAKIESVATTFVLRDLESTNGTFVNKKKISLHNLRDMDVILIGKHELVFDRSDLMAKSDPKAAVFDDDKTRILDTSQFRELTRQEADNTSAIDTGRNRSRLKRNQSFLARLLTRLFG